MVSAAVRDLTTTQFYLNALFYLGRNKELGQQSLTCNCTLVSSFFVPSGKHYCRTFLVGGFGKLTVVKKPRPPLIVQQRHKKSRRLIGNLN